MMRAKRGRREMGEGMADAVRCIIDNRGRNVTGPGMGREVCVVNNRRSRVGKVQLANIEREEDKKERDGL